MSRAVVDGSGSRETTAPDEMEDGRAGLVGEE